jgi:hypothetical protein
MLASLSPSIFFSSGLALEGPADSFLPVVLTEGVELRRKLKAVAEIKTTFYPRHRRPGTRCGYGRKSCCRFTFTIESGFVIPVT